MRQKSCEKKKRRDGRKKLKQNQLKLEKTISSKLKKDEKSADDDLAEDRFADADHLDCGDSDSEINEIVSCKLKKIS